MNEQRLDSMHWTAQSDVTKCIVWQHESKTGTVVNMADVLHLILWQCSTACV